MAGTAVEKSLTVAGVLIASGLAVQLAVSFWVHPLAFVTFLGIACPLVVAGIVVFCRALIIER